MSEKNKKPRTDTGGKNIYIAMDNIRSLYNVGSIMRTCSFFGLTKIVLIGYSGTKFNFKGEKVLHHQLAKTALGAEEDMEEVVFIENAEELYWFAEEKGLKIVSIEQHEDSVGFGDWRVEDNCIVVFGNEVKGVSPEIMEISDEIVEIERLGNKGSLNVATTAGIVVEAVAAGD